MSHHLHYRPGAVKPTAVNNQRNGTGAKTILPEEGLIRIEYRATAMAVSNRR
ncbi:hypothetical protein [Burkholderia sp. SRS-W-2-2016]|uniref:hypothetical protein n=1 Tax=Burkholderia sp. SRS-W-2-2016 TaxID=1926878 RepID=UPI000B28027D